MQEVLLEWAVFLLLLLWLILERSHIYFREEAPLTFDVLQWYLWLLRLFRGGKMDYNFVDLRLATGGGIVVQADVDKLAADGITAVIDCRDDFDDASLLSSHPSIAYLYCPTADDGQPKPPEWFGKGIDFALGILAKPKTKVYAHCAAGSNRGPSMALAILLAQGLDFGEALALVQKARPNAQIRYRQDAENAVKALGYV